MFHRKLAVFVATCVAIAAPMALADNDKGGLSPREHAKEVQQLKQTVREHAPGRADQAEKDRRKLRELKEQAQEQDQEQAQEQDQEQDQEQEQAETEESLGNDLDDNNDQ